MALTGPACLIELDITETGDAALWTENHTGFTLESVTGRGTHIHRLDLAWVPDPEDVVANETTLVNPDPSYYAAWCTNAVE